MVLIIRNSRIQSRDRSRFKRLFSCVIPREGKSINRSRKINSVDMSLVNVLGTLFLYSAAMFTLPFLTFFGVQNFLNTEYHMEKFTSNCISVLAAVVVVNLIIACYVYKALMEPDEPKNDDGIDEEGEEEDHEKRD